MQDLIMQERFELEVLDRLNSGKFLTQIIFGGRDYAASMSWTRSIFRDLVLLGY